MCVVLSCINTRGVLLPNERGAYVSTSKEIPLYALIKNDIKKSIRQGVLSVGSQLPASRTLSETYGCSVNTVERALTELSREGYLERKERLGTFVRPEEYWGMLEYGPSFKTIGAIMVDISNGIWSSVTRDRAIRHSVCPSGAISEKS